MHNLWLAGFLALSNNVAGYPAEHSTTDINPRMVVDLNAYRLAEKSEYIDTAKVEDNVPALTIAQDANYVDIATELVKQKMPHATFRVIDDHYVGNNGVAHVYFRQTLNGIDIDNADFNVNVKDGQIFSFGNSFYTGPSPKASALAKPNRISPVQALKAVVKNLQIPVDADKATAQGIEGNEAFVLKGTSGALSDPKAHLVYFKKADDSLVLTWKVETDIDDDWLISYIDAKDGKDIQGVVNWVADATFQVFPFNLNDPTSGERKIITDPWNTTVSPNGWFNDGKTSYTATRGNNVIAQDNPRGGNDYLNNYRPNKPDLKFEYPYSLTMTPPSSYKDAAITQLFYTCNMYHDLFYLLGFDEKSGNFQVSNNGKGGREADFVIANAQDGSGKNNANFATPPDGQPGRMRMYTWDRSNPQRDGDFEAGIVIHEYSHGLSNRLTGGGGNANCLSGLESGGMGEGWGDFLATAITLKASDTRAKNVHMGAWAMNDAKGIREYPYSTSMTTNPLTYVRVNNQRGVHAVGTTWASMLYEVLWNLIDKHGKNDGLWPIFNGKVPTDGKFLAMKLVVDGMALQPCNPNFVQARDAILDADKALTGGANACEIWTGFAKRGLGQGAVYNASRRTESKTIPTGVCKA
ncbi:Extracellular metalloproteinase 9 [Myotisia sp. PD_48]|nr:Extracellular metalloproteinase 9 [Myotisia sp. PD_48]